MSETQSGNSLINIMTFEIPIGLSIETTDFFGFDLISYILYGAAADPSFYNDYLIKENMLSAYNQHNTNQQCNIIDAVNQLESKYYVMLRGIGSERHVIYDNKYDHRVDNLLLWSENQNQNNNNDNNDDDTNNNNNSDEDNILLQQYIPIDQETLQKGSFNAQFEISNEPLSFVLYTTRRYTSRASRIINLLNRVIHLTTLAFELWLASPGIISRCPTLEYMTSDQLSTYLSHYHSKALSYIQYNKTRLSTLSQQNNINSVNNADNNTNNNNNNLQQPSSALDTYITHQYPIPPPEPYFEPELF